MRNALLLQPIHELTGLLTGQVNRFPGAGIYALYYSGNFAPYLPIARLNRQGKFDAPIYVGRAVPKESRKGATVESERPSTALYDRLRIHAEGLRAAENIEAGDFRFRYLVVDDVWIPLGETYMINRFRPLWNYVVTGFGIKTPGQGRKGQVASLWDTFHPGRSFVKGLELPANPRTTQDIARDVAQFLTLPDEAKAALVITEEAE